MAETKEQVAAPVPVVDDGDIAGVKYQWTRHRVANLLRVGS